MRAIEKHNEIINKIEELYEQLHELGNDVEKEVMNADDSVKEMRKLLSSTIKFDLFTKLRKQGLIK